MTRFVDEERTNAGILRHWAIITKDIILKFVLYGFFAGTIGTPTRNPAGPLFPIGDHFQHYYARDGDWREQRVFYGDMTLIALGLSFVASVLPAYWVSRKELKEEANLVITAQTTGIWFEDFPGASPVYLEASEFHHKVTARNLFRYKQRMLMTIFGVAGSVALLFAGLGIQSSVGGFPNANFKRSYPMS